MDATYRLGFLLFCCLSNIALAQQSVPPTSLTNNWEGAKRNAAYFEFFGGTSLYSLNYQRVTTSQSKLTFTYRVGASVLPGYTTLTGYLGGIWGSPKRAVELLMGAGYYGIKKAGAIEVNFPDEEKNHNVYLTPQLGYRNQSARGGLLFRAMLTPYLYLLPGQGVGKFHMTPGFGISIGKAF